MTHSPRNRRKTTDPPTSGIVLRGDARTELELETAGDPVSDSPSVPVLKSPPLPDLTPVTEARASGDPPDCSGVCSAHAQAPERRCLSAERLSSKVVRDYLPLVHQVVSQFAKRLPANVLRDDLLAAGVFGLLDSLRKNGETRGAAFEWYARTRIRGAIFDELRAQDWLTRRARAAATAGGAEGRPAAVAAVISLQEVSALEESQHLVAINDDPEARIEALHDGRALAEAMQKLPERERCILRMHYFNGVKFKDIGVELGVSEPRISQLHARALGRLRLLLDHAA